MKPLPYDKVKQLIASQENPPHCQKFSISSDDDSYTLHHVPFEGDTSTIRLGKYLCTNRWNTKKFWEQFNLAGYSSNGPQLPSFPLVSSVVQTLYDHREDTQLSEQVSDVRSTLEHLISNKHILLMSSVVCQERLSSGYMHFTVYHDLNSDDGFYRGIRLPFDEKRCSSDEKMLWTKALFGTTTSSSLLKAFEWMGQGSVSIPYPNTLAVKRKCDVILRRDPESAITRILFDDSDHALCCGIGLYRLRSQGGSP